MLGFGFSVTWDGPPAPKPRPVRVTEPGWPHGARAACAFTFDLDAETLWLARGVTESPSRSPQGTFGVLEALPRILDLLRQAEIRASFFVPAWVAEHHPEAVPAIVAGGHEVGCHGDVHERVSDPRRGPGREDSPPQPRGAHSAGVVGARSATERRPGELSERTLSLLARHGFEYSSNDDGSAAPLPARAARGQATGGDSGVLVLDDAPFFMFTGQRAMQPPGPVLQAWLTEAGRHHGDRQGDQLHVSSADHRTTVALCLPAGAWWSTPRRTPKLWLARLDQIAAHARTALG